MVEKKEKLNIVLILGSVRVGRLGIRLAKYALKKLEEKHNVTFVDLKEDQYSLPLLDKPHYYYEKGEKIPEQLENISKILNDADCFVLVSGEYNHSIQPALSNFLDYFYDEYGYKPTGIISYSDGGFGGVRSATQLKEFLLTLNSPPIAHMPVPKIDEAFDENGNAIDKTYDKNISKFIGRLEFYAYALKEQRKKGIPK